MNLDKHTTDKAQFLDKSNLYFWKIQAKLKKFTLRVPYIMQISIVIIPCNLENKPTLNPRIKAKNSIME